MPAPVVTAAIELLPVEAVTSTRLVKFHDYWRSKMEAGRLPRREDMDLAELKHLLQYLVVAELETSPFRVFYRLSGTKIATHDQELTGKYLDEVVDGNPPWTADFHTLYAWVAAERQPVIGQSHVISPYFGGRTDFYFGIWPLSSTGVVVDRCFSLQDFLIED